MSNDAIQATMAQNKIDAGKVTIGETVTATGNSAVLYSDSAGTLQEGALPFAQTMAGVVVTGMASTTISALDVTGASNPGSADTLMQGQLVVGSRVTTFTKTGFIQVNVVDSAGNLTDGVHYIQLGTLS